MKEDIKSKQHLLAYTNEEIIEAFDFQKKNGLWNFYDERHFCENLLSQRFNYLILVYSIFASAAVATYNLNQPIILILIFGLGTSIVSMICVTIFRVYAKVIISLDILDSLGELHVFKFIRHETSRRKIKFSYANKIIGIYLPRFCFYTLLTGLLVSILQF